MTTFKVGYLIGSLAKESINRKLAKALIRLAPNHELRLSWGKANRSLAPAEPLGARRGLREEDEMENGRAVAWVLW